jgi:class 3 adenylate cyclase/Tfp pilus assembly protein PilF
MADLNKMDRTWLCSVLFMDIAKYSSQSVELQMRWKQRFNTYLADAIRDVPENERVILDTGDGAAVCFLGAPEAAMFAALQLCSSFILDERDQKPGLRVRLGINLGPVKLVRDLNGALNALGDGINAGQRVMSFASENQILVSQSFFEVVSRLSDDYKQMFELKGVETDKSVRMHTVYHLIPPGAERRAQTFPSAAIPIPTTIQPQVSPARSRSFIPWLIAALATTAVAAVLMWHFYGTPAPAAKTPIQVQETAALPIPEPPVQTAQPDPAPAAPVAKTAPPSVDAQSAYDDGVRFLDKDKAADAARRFDAAIHAQPDFLDAYVKRAEARRRLKQYDQSLEDCNKVIQLKPDDPRGYNCRGYGHQLLRQFEAAIPDFNEAIRCNPNFVLAYEHRGTTYTLLQKYDRAVADYTEAIQLSPKNAVFYIRRGTAYSYLRQFDKAIQDYTDAILLDPRNKDAHRLRAAAEEASGNRAAAAADRKK